MIMKKNLPISISVDDLQLEFYLLLRKYKESFIQAFDWKEETVRCYLDYLQQIADFFRDYQQIPFYALTENHFEYAINDNNFSRLLMNQKKYAENTNKKIRSALNDFCSFIEFYSNEYYIKVVCGYSLKEPEKADIKPVRSSKRTSKLMEEEKEKRINTITQPKSLTLDQEIRLYNAIDIGIEKNSYYAGMALCFYLGLRPGECCGVKYGDIRPLDGYSETQCLYIYEQIKNNDKTSNDLKTANAYRVLPVPEELYDLLLRRKTAVEKRLQGKCDHCYIVCAGETIKGLQISCYRDEFREFSQRILRSIKVEGQLTNQLSTEISSRIISESSVTTYLLRRNFATALSGVCGMEDDELKYLMGHAIGAADEKRHDFVNPDVLYHLWKKLNLRSYKPQDDVDFTIDSYDTSVLLRQKCKKIKISPTAIVGGALYIRVFNEFPNDYVYAEIVQGRSSDVSYRTALEPSELKRIGRIRLHNEFTEAVQAKRNRMKEKE